MRVQPILRMQRLPQLSCSQGGEQHVSHTPCTCPHHRQNASVHCSSSLQLGLLLEEEVIPGSLNLGLFDVLLLLAHKGLIFLHYGVNGNAILTA